MNALVTWCSASGMIKINVLRQYEQKRTLLLLISISIVFLGKQLKRRPTLIITSSFPGVLEDFFFTLAVPLRNIWVHLSDQVYHRSFGCASVFSTLDR